MNEALEAEFNTVASWTADVAMDLGVPYRIPAACRGSNPAVLKALIDALRITGTDRMLDCGAGAGGPAAFAGDQVGVRPILTDPESGACQAAGAMFGLPTVQAASDLPFRSGSFDLAWSLGVLCTVADQGHLLEELHRVVTEKGRLGLLVFVAATSPLSTQPEGNHFPTVEELDSLLTGAGWAVDSQTPAAAHGKPPPGWQERADAVEAELDRRHHDDPIWQTAAHQSEVMSELLASGEVTGTVIIAHRR